MGRGTPKSFKNKTQRQFTDSEKVHALAHGMETALNSFKDNASSPLARKTALIVLKLHDGIEALYAVAREIQ